jgi:pantoate--beta-alanine ligase
MILFRRSSDLQQYLESRRTNNRSIGFVPTMGALHAGHLALIERSLERDQFTVCSIFVNPTQFNDANDLEQYPRTPGKDLEWLSKVGCDLAFLPTVAEVYPDGTDRPRPIDFRGLDQRLEGAHRPGHFAGVAQVVERLLRLVAPNRLYLGQKDYQQVAIIRRMIDALALPVAVEMVPTVREADGLALSSRNVRLGTAERAAAPLIHQILEEVRERFRAGEDARHLERAARTRLAANEHLRPEYFEIVDGQTLDPWAANNPQGRPVACTAVWAGDVRLIDNLLL